MAAKQTFIIVATAFVITLFCSGMVSAQAPGLAPAAGPAAGGAVALGPSAEAPTPDCMTNLLNLSDCLTYVTAGSNLTKPDKPCCPELAGLVESSPQCLCYLLDKNRTAAYGISIDMNRALNLPSVCHVSTPPVSLCSAIIGAAPFGSPTPSEGPNSPVGSTTPSGGSTSSGLGGLAPEGLAPGPSNGVTNGASNIAISGLASLLALAIAFPPTLFGI